MLYSIPNCSMFVRIVKVRYQNRHYMKATVEYYSRPSLTLLTREINCRIEKANIKHWQKFTDEGVRIV